MPIFSCNFIGAVIVIVILHSIHHHMLNYSSVNSSHLNHTPWHWKLSKFSGKAWLAIGIKQTKLFNHTLRHTPLNVLPIWSPITCLLDCYYLQSINRMHWSCLPERELWLQPLCFSPSIPNLLRFRELRIVLCSQDCSDQRCYATNGGSQKL